RTSRWGWWSAPAVGAGHGAPATTRPFRFNPHEHSDRHRRLAAGPSDVAGVLRRRAAVGAKTVRPRGPRARPRPGGRSAGGPVATVEGVPGLRPGARAADHVRALAGAPRLPGTAPPAGQVGDRAEHRRRRDGPERRPGGDPGG